MIYLLNGVAMDGVGVKVVAETAPKALESLASNDPVMYVLFLGLGFLIWNLSKSNSVASARKDEQLDKAIENTNRAMLSVAESVKAIQECIVSTNQNISDIKAEMRELNKKGKGQ